jgi:hypothetical protein
MKDDKTEKRMDERMMTTAESEKMVMEDLSEEFWDEFIEFIETHDDLGVLLFLKSKLSHMIEEEMMYAILNRAAMKEDKKQ